MEIIIGREEGLRRLHCVADGRAFNIGAAGTVPTSVSRNHCRIIINGSQMTIENLKIQNVTYVDDNQVFSKAITLTSRVQLGEERFSIPLQQIVALAMGSPLATGAQTGPRQPQPAVPTFSLKPLKSVWEEYDRQKLNIQNEAARNANRQRLQGILSLIGMCIGFIPGIDPTIRYVIIAAALAMGVYFFYKGATNDTVQQKIHDLDEEFAKRYKCPNPKCGRSFGTIPYRQIEYNKKCLACGCNYTH